MYQSFLLGISSLCTIQLQHKVVNYYICRLIVMHCNERTILYVNKACVNNLPKCPRCARMPGASELSDSDRLSVRHPVRAIDPEFGRS